MGRTSDDPYGDFVVRIMNSCRIALGQTSEMSEAEFNVVRRIRHAMIQEDANAEDTIKASIVIRRDRF